MQSTLNLEMRRTTLLRSAESIVDKALRENRAMRPAEEIDYEGVTAKLDSIDRTLGRASMFGRNQGEPGALFTRIAMALAGSGGNMRGALERAGVSRDHEVTRALSASVSSQGGFAVPMGYSSDIISALRPMVAVRKLNPVTMPMANGNLTIPRISAGATASYLGENAVVPSQAQSFAALKLTAKKLPALVPISNDLVRYAKPAGNLIVMRDILAALAAVEDFNFINGNGTAYSPKGLINWALAANTIAANATVNIANTDNDLGALESALINANVSMQRPGWIFSPRTLIYLKNLRGSGGDKVYPELDYGQLRGYPYAASNNVPLNLGTGSQSVVILADFNDVIIGEAELTIDVATEGSYVDGGGATVSAFTADQTIVRIIAQHDLGMLRQESVAILTGVSWIPVA
jgi:HK97 family phage major capsid protein